MHPPPVGAAPAKIPFARYFDPAECTILAILASAAALACILQVSDYFKPAPPETCQTILSRHHPELFITPEKQFLPCYREQQRAVGASSTEECQAALTQYIPQHGPFLQIVDSVGGPDAFCSLPVKQIPDSLQIVDDYKGYAHLTVLQTIVNSMHEGETPPTLSRGVDAESLRLFVAGNANATITQKNHLGDVLYLDANTPFIDKDIPHGIVYFQGWENPNHWHLAVCEASKRACYHTEVQNLKNRDIVDLGRLVAGDTVCNTDYLTETCLKLL